MSKSLKSSLKLWVSKTFKNENKPKRFMKDVANKITVCNLKESKNQLEDIIAEDLFNKIEEIRIQKGTPADAEKVLENFLLHNLLAPSSEIQNLVTPHLINYFNNYGEEIRNLQDSLENVYNSTSNTYDCICPKTTKDLQLPQRTQSCYRCKRECHTNCLWGAEENAEQYECPLCFGCYCLPNRRVEQILFGGYLRQTKKDKIGYKIILPLKQALRQDQAMQVRCMRLGKDNKFEFTWPENCTVYFNHKKLAEFKPLPISSSLKRRVDQQIAFDKKMILTENLLIIQEKHQYIEGSRNAISQNHFIIVVIVQILPSNLVEEQLMKNRLTIEQSKQQLKWSFDRSFQEQCFIQKIKISLNCHFYGMKITTPVRSQHCRSHYQPFDLKNFILANNNTKNSVQKWKCPICKKRAYDIQVDDYLLSIINNNPSQLMEIQFIRAELDLPPNKTQQSSKKQEKDTQLQNRSTAEQEHLIKTQSKNVQLNKCELISIDQFEQKPKPYYQQCIQLDDSLQQKQDRPRQTNNRSFKRSYKSRSKQNMEQPKLDILKKKNKCDDNRAPTIVQELSTPKQSNSVQQLQSISSKNYNSDLQSQYCEGDDQEFKDNRRKPHRGSSNNRRTTVLTKKHTKEPSIMTKTIAPSPNIRTVIPEAIRINEVRLPQPKKVACQQQIIQIIEEQQQTVQKIRQRKLQYHKSELQKQKTSLSKNENEAAISQQEEAIFLALCEKFMASTQID